MPRIRVVGADPAAAPRAYALLHQFNDTAAGEVDSQVLAQYANAGLGALDGEVTFNSFVKAVEQPSQLPGAEGEGNTLGWGAVDTTGKLRPLKFVRREVGSSDVFIKITHAGICHSDLHTITGDWGKPAYPVVPGHEIVGIVTAVGSGVTRFQPGDRAGVGVFVDSCRECEWCVGKDETYCPKLVWTYNAKGNDGLPTAGGYSTGIVVDEAYALKVPSNLPLERAAPLLCAGVTVWTPLKDFGLDKPGLNIGVVGLGGLGHMAVKFAKAFGATVTVISRTHAKDEAARALGADHFLASSSEEELKAAAGTLHGIIDTVSALHDVNALLALLPPRGQLCMVGLPSGDLGIKHQPIIMKHLSLNGSIIGNLKTTQEMLDFCGEHNVVCDTEVIDIQQANEAMVRMEAGDVRFRFVIDIQRSLIQ